MNTRLQEGVPLTHGLEDMAEVNQLRPKTETIKNLGIQQVDRGYVVTVGCQTIVIETKEALIKHLTNYIISPHETERKYNEGTLF